MVQNLVAVVPILGPLDGSHVPHGITADGSFSHQISEVPVSTAEHLAYIFCFQPLLLFLSIEPCDEEVN